VAIVDDQCKATDDVRTGPATPDLSGSASKLLPVGGPQRAIKTRGGCCGTGGGEAAWLGAFVTLVLSRRRK
jgi:hypothetical protein